MSDIYKVIITEKDGKYLSVYLKGDEPLEIKLFDNNDAYAVGSIYLGEIKEKKENINSSFVSINKDKTCYFRNTEYKNGSLVPVMIKKKTIGDKQDYVTDDLSIPGIYNVVFRDKLIKRTNANFADNDSVVNEAEYLKEVMGEVLLCSSTRNKGALLYKSKSELINYIFSIRFDMLDEVITDSDFVYDILEDFISAYTAKNIAIEIKIKKYCDNLVSLWSLYSLNSKLKDAISKKVWLKSGAYIYIEPTEALTVIDVNTGNTTFKKSKDETVHLVNMEAAKEIIKQFRLRNLSGIIIVDFINVHDSRYNDELMEFITSEIKSDNRKAKCFGMTKLGLYEFKRDRVDLPLHVVLKDLKDD